MPLRSKDNYENGGVMKKTGLEIIARACARHPWRTLAVWAVVLVCAATVTVLYLGGALTNEDSFTNDPESFRATALINEAFPGNHQSPELVIVRSAGLTVDDQAFREQVQAVSARVLALGPAVVQAGMDYTTDSSPVLISTDRHAALLIFNMTHSAGAAVDDAEALAAAARGAAASTGFEVLVTGEASINPDFGATAERDLRTGEIFGVGIALVILVLVFGAVVTAAVPLIMAMASILLALGITALVGRVMDLSFFITNMITMIGLAMGIDYSLFVVSRYREERAAGRDEGGRDRPGRLHGQPFGALQRAGRHPGAGRAVPGAVHAVPQHGDGRDHRRVHRAAGRAHPAPALCWAHGRQGERLAGALPAQGRRGLLAAPAASGIA